MIQHILSWFLASWMCVSEAEMVYGFRLLACMLALVVGYLFFRIRRGSKTGIRDQSGAAAESQLIKSLTKYSILQFVQWAPTGSVCGTLSVRRRLTPEISIISARSCQPCSAATCRALCCLWEPHDNNLLGNAAPRFWKAQLRTHAVGDVEVAVGVYEQPDDLGVVAEHGEVQRRVVLLF